ncbi:MAG: CorA family divalent cation transporter [Clostridiales bacterium]|uniref:CorA family divalent cation transporter n=1 Tax=Terrisporobacter sp. TaxID=1965305 RepID=UPI002A574E44|nr:CorA family divalent cation transporter [Terrisporobacter sp.]MCI5628765.1 CorA family divalent cation transporter [Clostridium sp.]MDD7752905.1 CorA family divalent cation transporter [Clostridiales bacterium]MDY4134163.1 CorA family divalent cation transporter [Terrisporobacter sp.]
MHILNLKTKQISKNINEVNFNEDYNFIVCNPWELKFFKDKINLDRSTYKDCLSFDDQVRVEVLDEYIYFTLNNFHIIEDGTLTLEEINIFLSEKYIILVLRNKNNIFDKLKSLINETFYYKSNLTLSLLILYSSILRIIIRSQFENLEKVEEIILQLEDQIINGVDDHMSAKISSIRGISRTCVKAIRPLTYYIDTLLKDGMEFFAKYNNHGLYLEEEYRKLLEGLDLSIDKLYTFSLSTRELSDKLLDIYTSMVSEKTNNLINKLTFFTGTAVPISIITGIYGMNFKYMPELKYVYSYPIIIFIIVSIMVVAFIMFKKNKFL